MTYKKAIIEQAEKDRDKYGFKDLWIVIPQVSNRGITPIPLCITEVYDDGVKANGNFVSMRAINEVLPMSDEVASAIRQRETGIIQGGPKIIRPN